MATAKTRWEKLNGKRDAILRRARDAAELTIPALMPPEGHTENSDLSQPYQSLGARGVNNLASKLVLALMPTGTPFFKLQTGEGVEENLNNSSEVQEALRQIEKSGMRRVESGNLRTVLHSVFKLLVCTGNTLLYLPTVKSARAFRLSQYVVCRDAMGNWKEIVIKETVHPSTMDESIVSQMELSASDDSEDIEVFTHVRRMGKKVEWHQEIDGKRVPDSDGKSDYENSPYIPLRWTAVENEDYGRGHVEEYIGDLRSLEGLSKSIVQFAAAAAKVIFLERPNSTTDLDELNEAMSGDFVTGNPEDIATLQLEKFPDFQTAKSTADDLTLRLSHAFLLTTGTVRNAERVTAEEVRMQAQELEDVLGGVYTVQTQELQLPITRRIMSDLKKDGVVEFPKDSVEPVIVTGFDALGRGHELNKLRAYFSDGVALFGDAFLNEFSPRRVAELMATHGNVDAADLFKTDDEKADDAQAAQAGVVLDKAAGPVASAVAGATADQATS